MAERQKVPSGVWVVVALLAFAAVVGLGRMLLLRDSGRPPATGTQR